LIKSVRTTVFSIIGVLSLCFTMLSIAPANAASLPPAPVDGKKAIAQFVATLPAPSELARNTTSGALSLPNKKGLVVTCLAGSRVVTASAGSSYYSVIGEATTSCPAPVDFASAQSSLFMWVPDLERYTELSVGSLAYDQPYVTPGKNLTSLASSSCRAAEYLVIGFHQARLGSSYATAVTAGESGYFSFCS